VKTVKAKSSKWLNDGAHAGGFRWQRGYGAFTVSESKLHDVVSYVERQEEHHRRLSFRDEHIMLLERHGIPYDERYLPA